MGDGSPGGSSGARGVASLDRGSATLIASLLPIIWNWLQESHRPWFIIASSAPKQTEGTPPVCFGAPHPCRWAGPFAGPRRRTRARPAHPCYGFGSNGRQPGPRPWTVEELFAWQDKQDTRYELVAGFPLKMTVGVRNVHDDVVVNIIAALGNRLRGRPCRPFTGESAIETLPGQIRRPDVGIDCGRRDPNGYKAAEPRMVLEVLSPGTRDFDTFEKLGEYKTVETLDHIVFVDPDCADVVHWTRAADRLWERRVIEEVGGVLDLPDLGVSVPLREIYDDVTFPPRLRPRIVGDGR